jgi:hypothetical protein
MTAQRQRILSRARIATAGLVLAAGSATGLITVAAAHATNGTTTSSTDEGERESDDSGSTGSSQHGTSRSSDNGSNNLVVGTHSS